MKRVAAYDCMRIWWWSLMMSICISRQLLKSYNFNTLLTSLTNKMGTTVCARLLCLLTQTRR